MKSEKKIIGALLKKAGIAIDGGNSYDIQIHNEDLYRRVLQQGSLGLGESYMEGWWDCESLDEFFNRILTADLEKEIKYGWRILLSLAGQVVFNAGRKSKAFDIGERHYDTGNDLYGAMLDKRLTYTCGYWKDADNLDEAMLDIEDFLREEVVGLPPEDAKQGQQGESSSQIQNPVGHETPPAIESGGSTLVDSSILEDASEVKGEERSRMLIRNAIKKQMGGVKQV